MLLSLLMRKKELRMQSGKPYSDEYSLPKPPDYEPDTRQWYPLPPKPRQPDEYDAPLSPGRPTFIPFMDPREPENRI